jgi:transcriptional regulator GlxA family with amidase domain
MSRYYFVRRYRQRFGQSPIADLRRMRVELARELIESTDLPFYTIAERSGFSTVITCRGTFGVAMA